MVLYCCVQLIFSKLAAVVKSVVTVKEPKIKKCVSFIQQA